MAPHNIQRKRRRPFAALAALVAALTFAFGTAGSASAADGGSVASTATGQIGGSCSQYDNCPVSAWCAQFAMWVWAQNGVDMTGLNADASSFYDYGVSNGTLSSTPQVGDAVVFNYDGGSDWADHVAIVTKVNSDGTIVSVGGNERTSAGVVAQDGPYSSALGYSSYWQMSISGYIAPVWLSPAAAPAQLVAIGDDDGVYHEIRNPNGTWTGFAPVKDSSGNVMKASAISIAGDPDGSSQLVAVGGDGYLYHEVRRADGTWSGFQYLAGVGTPHMAATAVSITADPDGSAQLVAIGSDGDVYHEIRDHDGTWTGFQAVAGIGTPKMAARAVSITADPDGSAQLVVIGTDGYVYHEARQAGGTWTGFAPIAGVGTPKMAATAVSITADPDGSAQVVAVGSDGDVYHEIRDHDGTWTGFAPVAGVGTPKMAAVAVSITGDPDGSAQLVAVGNDGDVYHEVRQASGHWTGFAPVAGVGTPKMAAGAVSIASVPGAA